MAAAWRSSREYVLALVWVVASTVCAYFVQPYAQIADLAMIQLLGIALLASRFSVRASVVAALFGILAFDFFFIPPLGFAWTDLKASLMLTAMLVVAFMISSLNQQLRQQELVARATAARAEALYRLNLELSGASDLKQLRAVASRQLESLFAARVSILLRNAEGTLERPHDAADAEPAERAWMRQELTSRADDQGCSTWVPLAGVHAPLGVLGLRVAEPIERDSAQGFLLMACANQLAIALERGQLASAVQRTQLEAETERLRNSLLSAVSHDLKTPLATIIAAGTTLVGRRAELDAAAADDLAASIVSEGERLSRMIQNLLSIARLESPTIELRRTPEAIEEIVSAAIERVSPRLVGHAISVDFDPDLPLVVVEPLLLEQVVSNLLENAVRHAGPSASVFVRASAGDAEVTVQVADDGLGVAPDEHDKVFEKFYRGRRAAKGDGGAGLGLTICRAIVRAHGGRIVLRQRSGGGTLVEFALPLAPPPEADVELQASEVGA